MFWRWGGPQGDETVEPASFVFTQEPTLAGLYTGRIGGGIVRIVGAHPQAPIHRDAGVPRRSQFTTSGRINAPAVKTNSPNCLILRCWGHVSSTTITPPEDMTTLWAIAGSGGGQPNFRTCVHEGGPGDIGEAHAICLNSLGDPVNVLGRSGWTVVIRPEVTW
jgi:hypothetical protein